MNSAEVGTRSPRAAGLVAGRHSSSQGRRDVRIGGLTSAIFAALTLGACAPHPVAIVHCVSPQQLQKLKSAEPERVGPKLTGQAQDDLKIIAGNNVELRQYGHNLLGVIEGCSGS